MCAKEQRKSSIIFAAARESFKQWKQSDLFDRLETSHQLLLDRRKDTVEFPCEHELRERTVSNCMVLQQVLLHRSERLLTGAVTMVCKNNIYGLTLLVRGHYVLGYICDRLESVKHRNLEFPDFAFDIASTVLGAKHCQLRKAPKPPNILTCIEKADRYLDAHHLRQKTGMIRDGYDWLSNFVHPNFLSHTLAFKPDKTNRRFVFSHEGRFREVDFEHVKLLDISTFLFLRLFDDLKDKLMEEVLTK